MTDQATLMPAPADNMTPPVVPAAAPNPAPVADWSASVSEDARKVVTAKGWKTPDDAVKSYAALESEFGKVQASALKVPGPDAKPEDVDALHMAIGRPE